MRDGEAVNDGDTALTLQTCPDVGLGVVVDAEALGPGLLECVGEHVERVALGAEVFGDVGVGIGCCGDGVDAVRLPSP